LKEGSFSGAIDAASFVFGFLVNVRFVFLSAVTAKPSDFYSTPFGKDFFQKKSFQ
jgi:hypothetical protein